MTAAAVSAEPGGLGARRALREPWRPWLWAVLLAAAWHAVWWLGVQPRRLTLHRLRPSPVRVSYLPVSSEVDSASVRARDMRRVWSPILFALPTSMGFSRPVLDQDSGLTPPLELRGSSPMFLARPAAPRAGRPSYADQLEEEARRALGRLPEAKPMERVFRPVPAGELPPVFVERSPELEARGHESQSLPEVPGNGPWQAVALVGVDAGGGIEHVFLERGTGSPQRDAVLVRTLYGWRFQPGDAAQTGRITLWSAGQPDGVEVAAP